MKLIKMFIPAVVCLLSLWVFFSVRTDAFAYEAINVTIPVDCFTVYGDNTHTYEVKIEPKNEEAPKPVSDSLNISEDGTGTFDISITEPGTYIYNIYEVAGSNENIQYDSSSYTVTVYAENAEDGGLRYSITACSTGSDSKAESIAFQDIVLSAAEKVPTTTMTTTTTTTTTTTATMTTLTDTTTAVTSTTTAVTTKKQSTDIISDIMTGDNFPAHAIRLVMLISAMTAIFAFLFKRDQSEEEKKNE
ncbi:pilin isopeptide linkage domain-containing protein [Ruminococcus sp. YRD2003]|uniref:Spy0128 family protein n=1 Tax=Ruminococcus sp. YRD2003 TaxID=1452313 RepID=UPI0008B3CDBE|nr:pilin isopeptide linkage domain-containing protein [Ruminococcus flavefaciens]